MRKKLINLIKILGIDLNEILIDIQLDFVLINSIEYVPYSNNIILHHFVKNSDQDLEFSFDGISKENKELIINYLSKLLYN